MCSFVASCLHWTRETTMMLGEIVSQIAVWSADSRNMRDQ